MSSLTGPCLDSPFPAGSPSGRRRRAVGILGGSFNPAHDGHLHISEEALRRLGLSEVWWMVSPQNPLKSSAGMADFDDRMESARRMARHPRIRVTDIETRIGTRHTALTLARLQKAHRDIRFVWLMGADNLATIHNWHRWHKIFTTVPIAVFARPPYDSRALAGLAATRFARARIPARGAAKLAWRSPPAWVFLAIPPHPASATAIRMAGDFSPAIRTEG